MTAPHPSYQSDPRVEDYIDALPDWQQAFNRGDAINAPALTAMLKQIVANNRAGGWRKLKARNPAG